ncbi:MAG: hypothetical protein A2096_13715 [Spirochaetes bacterium GWF1_41_5]|nr:MAG: hypothetical protein A2096_13715 [Spirochaetes bacterium GWF1_41_5]
MKSIEINPQICNGKPIIANTRIPVTIILDHLAAGKSIEDINNMYPELTKKQITDALNYCHLMIEHSEIELVLA